MQNAGYEFLDHTADIWVHAWGGTLPAAFEQCVYALMKTMTDPDLIEEKSTHEFIIEEETKGSLLIAFLSEFLFLFDTEFLIFKSISIDSITESPEGKWVLHGIGTTDKFDLDKHFQDTEVKAITYSYLEINETPEKTDIKVIYDI